MDEEEEFQMGFVLPADTTTRLLQLAAEHKRPPYECIVQIIDRAHRYYFDIPKEEWYV